MKICSIKLKEGQMSPDLGQILDEKVGRDLSDIVMVVLGSGLSRLFEREAMDVLVENDGGRVDGHPGVIALMKFAGIPSKVLVAMGRRHVYEGYSPEEVIKTISAAGERGLKNIILTNAAGGVHNGLNVGDIMLHTDYIATLLGNKRLVTAVGNSRNESVNPIDDELCMSLVERMAQKSVRLKMGAYVGVLGPSYETRAEVRMLRYMGTDAVGMSTVGEVECASAYGMRCVGMSLITNRLTDATGNSLNHEEVLRASNHSAELFRPVLIETIKSVSSFQHQ